MRSKPRSMFSPHSIRGHDPGLADAVTVSDRILRAHVSGDPESTPTAHQVAVQDDGRLT